MNDGVFDEYGRYYDSLYNDKDYRGESDAILKVLQDHSVESGKVLELGSGTGKHGALIAGAGYEVHGIEQSLSMVQRATQVQGFTCEVGDIRDFELKHRFKAALSLFHVMSYMPTTHDFSSVLENVNRCLEPGGIFIFDFWYSPAVNKQQPQITTKRVETEKFSLVRIAEPVAHPNESLVDVNYSLYVEDKASETISLVQESHRLRHYSLQEIDTLTTLYGFERIGAGELGTDRVPGLDTWAIYVVLRVAGK